MSKSSNEVKKGVPCCAKVTELERTMKNMVYKMKEDAYVINSYKAQIRLLRDTLKKVKKASNKALYDESCMCESLEIAVERRIHLKHDGKEIRYPGEETLEQYKKRKAEGTGDGSSSDSSS